MHLYNSTSTLQRRVVFGLDEAGITDIAVTERLLKGYRGVAVVVSESGIDTPEDIRRLDRVGARGFLVGESLLRGGHPRQKLEALCSALTDSGPTICNPGRREG